MMRALLRTGTIACAALLLAAFTFTGLVEELPIGSKAPMTDVEMKNVSGEMLSLSDVAQENGLIVIFSCNTCPWVDAWEDRYNPIAKEAEDMNIGMITVNSNAAYRDNGDSMADMQQRAEKMGYTFPYVLDQNSKLADAFGATKTPHVYMFDSSMKLVYRGAIDDNAREPEKVEETYLMDAMTAMVNGEEVQEKVTKSIGCTIKRAE